MTDRPIVLIVEDIPGTLAGNVAELSFADVTIHNSANIRDAIDKLERNFYAVILLDWRIPAQNGAPVDDDGGMKVLEMLKAQVGRKCDTPVIVVTAHRNAVDSSKLSAFTNVRAVVSKLRHDYISTLLEQALGLQLSVMR